MSWMPLSGLNVSPLPELNRLRTPAFLHWLDGHVGRPVLAAAFQHAFGAEEYVGIHVVGEQIQPLNCFIVKHI